MLYSLEMIRKKDERGLLLWVIGMHISEKFLPYAFGLIDIFVYY